MADAELTISANITGLREQLASIPGITAQQARAMAAELNKSIQESARQAKRAAAETERAYEQMGSAGVEAMNRTSAAATNANDATRDYNQSASVTAQRMQQTAGAADLLNPAFGNVARNVADVADLTALATANNSALLPVIAGVAAALALVTAAYSYYNNSQREQNELAAISRQAMQQQLPLLASLRNAQVDYAEAAGMINKQTADYHRLNNATYTQLQQITSAHIAETQAINNKIMANEKLAAAINWFVGQDLVPESFGQDVLSAAQSLGILGDSTDHLTKKREALTKAQEANVEIIRETLESERAAQDERDKAERAAERRAERDRKRAEAEAARERKRAEAARRRAEAEAAALKAAREAEEAERAREQAIMDVLKLNIEYADGIHSLTQAAKLNLTEEEKIIDGGAERLRQLNDLAIRTEYLATTTEQAAQARAQAEVSRAAIEADTEHQLAELREKLRNEELEAEQEASDEATKIREQRMQQFLDIAGYVSDGFGMVSSGLDDAVDNSLSKLDRLEAQYADLQDTMTEEERQATKKRIEAQRAAALRAFEIQKVGKLAEATVGGAAAVVQALASAPPPLNVIAAATTAAAVAGQLAAIASAQPAFHSGGMVPNSAAPDEVPARLITGEAVLSRTGRNMIGDDQINRANAGMSQPVQVVAVQQYRHRVYNDFVRDNLRLGGSLADAIRGSRTVGMREAV
jgi:hypothetical protein